MTTRDKDSALALHVGVREVAALFRVTKTTVGEWVRLGMPKAGPNSYKLADVIQWRRQRDIEAARATEGPLTLERRRLLEAQTRGHELANAEKAGGLLPAEDVRNDLAAIGDIMSAALDALPAAAVPGILGAGGDLAKVTAAVRAACRETRVKAGAGIAAYAAALADDVAD